MALRDLHARGIRPPAWAARLGDVTPSRAWRYRDVFGEREVFLLSFTYDSPASYDSPAGGGPEHAVLAEVNRCPNPRLVRAQVSRTVGELRELIGSTTGLDGRPLLLEEEIDPGDAGPRLRTALAHLHRNVTAESSPWILVLQARVQVLVGDPEAAPAPPAGGGDAPGDAGGDAAGRGHPGGTAAVPSFLDEVPPPTGVDADAFAFWATAITYCADATGSPPDRIGPLWLEHVLGEYVPTTFDLSPGQRTALAPAVTAWSRWAAARQGLPDTAVQQLVDRVAELDPLFDKTYAEPELAARRAYLSDVTDQALDGEHLEQTRARRLHALPFEALGAPETPDGGLPLDDPGHRHQILAEHLPTWELRDGESVPDWLAALTSVSDQLWDAEPPDLADAARDYLAQGFDETLLGDLTELAVRCGADRARFLDEARERLAIEEEW
jgi:hypothetical protein